MPRKLPFAYNAIGHIIDGHRKKVFTPFGVVGGVDDLTKSDGSHEGFNSS